MIFAQIWKDKQVEDAERRAGRAEVRAEIAEKARIVVFRHAKSPLAQRGCFSSFDGDSRLLTPPLSRRETAKEICWAGRIEPRETSSEAEAALSARDPC